MALVGFLEALHELCGVDFGTDKVGGSTARRLKGAAGTSIGAFFALLLVLGYSVAELRGILDGLTLEHMAAPNPILVFTELKAADDGTRLKSTISDLIRRKLGVPDATLAELARRTGVDLVTVATDSTTAAVRYLRAATEPAMSTVQAVYASMALPPLYPPLLYGGHALQDGGGMDYLPLGAFGPEARGHTVSAVLHWTSDGGIKKDEASHRHVLAYLARTVYCALYPAMVTQWCLLEPADRAMCIAVDATDVGTVEMDLTPALKERIRGKGYQDTAAALALMAAGLPPHRGASRFARKEGLPPYVHRLLADAARADAEYIKGKGKDKGTDTD